MTVAMILLQPGLQTDERRSRPIDTLPGPERSTAIDRFLLEQMKKARLPGLSAAVVQEGKVVWTGSYGWSDVAKRRRVDSSTLFQLASVSKTVTVCAVMQLVEREKLSLDEPIADVLPFAVAHPAHPESSITLRHLLTHTSGIRDNWKVLEDTWVKNGDFPKSLKDSLRAYLLPTGEYFDPDKNFYSWAPGSRQRYSNVGIALAAYLAEAKAGVSFELLCERGIFKPLGLTGCSFRLSALDRSKIAMPYRWTQKEEFEPLGHHGYLDFPAGTLRASAPQLARFLLSFIGEGAVDGVRVLREPTVAEMRRVSFPKIAPRQGLVWYGETVGGHEVLGHDGSDPGVSTCMYYRPADGVGVVLLVNGDPKARERHREETLLGGRRRHARREVASTGWLAARTCGRRPDSRPEQSAARGVSCASGRRVAPRSAVW